MKIEHGFTLLITGAGSGIGRALAIEFAKLSACISLVDLIEESGMKTLELVQQEYATFNLENKSSAIFVKCDVTKPDDVLRAFNKHKAVFNKLDACINCAGIGFGDIFDEDQRLWRRVIDVNLYGTIECTRHAIMTMRSYGHPGAIVNFSSALGIYPSPALPVYSASKAGVSMFTRSLVNLQKEGIRVNAICPEYVETPMTKDLPQSLVDAAGGYIPMETITKNIFEMVEDESKAGCCLWITTRYGVRIWPFSEEDILHTEESIKLF